jgi:transcriptional regulator with XRE-family HTH domain
MRVNVTPDYVRAVRERHGLTQRIFGELLGYTGPHIYRVENGRTPVSKSLAKLVYLFGTFYEVRDALAKHDVGVVE